MQDNEETSELRDLDPETQAEVEANLHDQQEVSVQNDFLFGSNGTRMSPILPVFITNRHQAYRMAAYVLVMAERLPEQRGQEGVTFEDVTKAVRNT